MRRIRLYVTMACLVMLAAACGKENGGTSNNNDSGSNLAGSFWRYYYSDLIHKGYQDEGGGIHFLSQTQVTIVDWEYEHGEYVEDVIENGTYEYNAPDGTLHLRSGNYRFFIDGNTLQLFNYDGEPQITMTRQ